MAIVGQKSYCEEPCIEYSAKELSQITGYGIFNVLKLQQKLKKLGYLKIIKSFHKNGLKKPNIIIPILPSKFSEKIHIKIDAKHISIVENILDNKILTNTAKISYLKIFDLTQYQSVFTLKKLQEQLAISRASLFRILKELESMRFLTRTQKFVFNEEETRCDQSRWIIALQNNIKIDKTKNLNYYKLV